MRLRPRLLIGTAVVAAIVGVAAAPAALAHVTVTAPSVTAGAGDAAITFRVPTESAAADTVEVQIDLPLDHPIAGVLVEPKPGWTATITQTKLPKPITTDDGEISEVVSQIDWRADAGKGVPPGYFGDFTIIGGKLPDGIDTLTFPTVQRYSDGKTVRWIQIAAPGSTAAPEFPAPVLDLSAAVAPKAASSDSASNTLGVIGIVVGAVGVLLGAAALALSRRRT